MPKCLLQRTILTATIFFFGGLALWPLSMAQAKSKSSHRSSPTPSPTPRPSPPATPVNGAADAAADPVDNPCVKLDDTKSIYNNETHKFRGCRVTSVKTGSEYDKMGLKTGDIVQPDSSRAHSMEIISGTAGESR